MGHCVCIMIYLMLLLYYAFIFAPPNAPRPSASEYQSNRNRWVRKRDILQGMKGGCVVVLVVF